MQAFVQDGHVVFLLTQAGKGVYHMAAEQFGVKTSAHPIPKIWSPIYFIRHAFYLARFCRKNQIHLVYAHLENAGLSAVLAQFLIKAKVITCRHIVDEAVLLNSRKFQLLNKLVYTLSRRTITVSQRSKDWMVEQEGIRAEKISVIPLAYNFKLFPPVNTAEMEAIRKRYNCEFLLLTACRLLPGKRPALSIDLCHQLRQQGHPVKLLILGEGPQRAELEQKVKKLGLEDEVFLLGFKNNPLDYLSACDLLVHPSLQDSSSVILKEAGLCRKAVICCRDVGDVNDYLEHANNALLVSRDNCLKEMIELIPNYLQGADKRLHLGTALEHSVRVRFDVKKILPEYQKIHKEIETYAST